MGYAFPASIGASLAKNSTRVISINGDGSFQINIQELQTLKYLNLPIKIFVFNNKGYGIIRQTQKEYFNRSFIGSDFLNKKSSLPSFSVKKIFNSFDIPIIETSSNFFDKKKLTKFFGNKKSSALIVNTKYSEIIKTYKKI